MQAFMASSCFTACPGSAQSQDLAGLKVVHLMEGKGPAPRRCQGHREGVPGFGFRPRGVQGFGFISVEIPSIFSVIINVDSFTLPRRE